MEENKKFRNHFSIVLERLGAGFAAFAMLLVYEGVELLGELDVVLRDIGNLKEEIFLVLLAALGLLIVIAIIVGVQIFRWAKTWISIQEQAIVIEVNTLKCKRNTIGIKNISNINLEQNLFEMIMGTCKVKMDTNSMSTADSTDVQIVLDKKQAQQFRAYILGMIENNYTETDKDQAEVFIEEQESTSGAGVEEMLIQGILSMKLIAIPLVIFSIIGVVGMISDALSEDAAMEGILSVLSTVILIGLFGISALWDIVNGFIRYYGFRIHRLEDRLHISYGLIKKVSYTIPVDKINAVKLVQSPQARFTGRYMAELVNVGMGDEKKEEQSFFLLYDKKDKIFEKVRNLLPEFADELDTEVCRQSSKVWIVWTWPTLIYVCAVTTVMAVASVIFKEKTMIVIAVIATITVLVMMYVVGNYFTRGYAIGEKSLKIISGNFGKNVLIVKYPKIQLLEIKQNFLAKHFQMQKGEIYLLASTANRIHNIPYFPEEEVEILRERILR